MSNGYHGFEIGDRVVALLNNPSKSLSIMAGDTGKVVDIDANFGAISVEWDNPVRCGHSCHFCAKDGFGWNVFWHEIALASDTEIKPPPVGELFDMLAF